MLFIISYLALFSLSKIVIKSFQVLSLDVEQV